MGRGSIIKKLLLVFLLPLVSAYSGDADIETNVTFQNFRWGTSQDEFIKKLGQPINREEHDGVASLIWENVFVLGYKTYMLAYFTDTGLQGGTYYFLTYDMNQLMKCYTEMGQELRSKYGPAGLFHPIQKELRNYECLWNVSGNLVHLKTNTRNGEPVTLMYISPELAKQIFDSSAR